MEKTDQTDKPKKFEDFYSSKILPINIPLPKFDFYHGASSEENVDSKFIGREKIIGQLDIVQNIV